MGKTTTTTLLFQLFTDLGYKVGLISTILNRIGEQEIKATHTTPNAIELNQLFVQMVEEQTSTSSAVIPMRIISLGGLVNMNELCFGSFKITLLIQPITHLAHGTLKAARLAKVVDPLVIKNRSWNHARVNTTTDVQAMKAGSML